jgi:hypothetical protein
VNQVYVESKVYRDHRVQQVWMVLLVIRENLVLKGCVVNRAYKVFEDHKANKV